MTAIKYNNVKKCINVNHTETTAVQCLYHICFGHTVGVSLVYNNWFILMALTSLSVMSTWALIDM